MEKESKAELIFKLNQKIELLGFQYGIRSIAEFRDRFPNALPMRSHTQIKGVIWGITDENLESWKQKYNPAHIFVNAKLVTRKYLDAGRMGKRNNRSPMMQVCRGVRSIEL